MKKPYSVEKNMFVTQCRLRPAMVGGTTCRECKLFVARNNDERYVVCAEGINLSNCTGCVQCGKCTLVFLSSSCKAIQAGEVIV